MAAGFKRAGLHVPWAAGWSAAPGRVWASMPLWGCMRRNRSLHLSLPAALHCPHPHSSLNPPLCPWQLYFLGLSAVVLLPLSLGIDGTHWGAQFGGWAARDWVVLVATSTAVYLGANAALQVGRMGA